MLWFVAMFALNEMTAASWNTYRMRYRERKLTHKRFEVIIIVKQKTIMTSTERERERENEKVHKQKLKKCSQ